MNRFLVGTVPSSMRTNGLRGLLGTAIAALACGCMSPIPYTPDESLVKSLGPEKAKQELEILLARSVEPQVGMVEVKDDALHYRWNQSSLGAFYQTVTTSIDTEIFYANLNRIEIYENHNVFIWGPNDARVDKVRFATAEEARKFADLLMSFRARWLASSAAPAHTPAPPAPPAQP